MDAREALEILHPDTTVKALNRIECFGEFYGAVARLKAIDEACLLACEALEKQVPNRPYVWGDGYSGGELVYDMWDCPNCGETYELDYDDCKYCPKCGQAILWEE